MSDVLKYKDYLGSVHFSAEDEVFYGKLEGINDLVTFEADTVAKLKKAFRESVEDYLDLCKQTGKEPDKMYKGSFNVRIKPELHKMAAWKAMQSGMSLNQLIEKSVKKYIELDDGGLKKV
jgi:predicted HicB family RNase H-like nuclease